MEHDEILTIPEVAKLLKIAEKTVYALAQKRALPGFKVGGQWRFSRSAINEWIDSRSRSSEPPPSQQGEDRSSSTQPRPRKGGH
jgi:excisionase family DNA binding protein